MFRSSLANLLGAVLPAIAALLAIPVLVHRLGAEQFGVLTIVTAITGYFTLLDVNVTSGSVKYVSEFAAIGQRKAVSQTVCFGGAIYLGIGLIGASIITALSETLAHLVLADDSALIPLTVECVNIAAWGFLFGQINIYLLSVPQALSRFDVSASVESVFGIAVPVLSMVAVLAGGDIVSVVGTRVALSAINLLILAVLVTRLLIPDFSLSWPGQFLRRQLVSFSAYAFLSRIAITTYQHADKLIIGALMGPAAVTLYAVPFTLVSRTFNFPYRIGAVFYPRASALAAIGDAKALRQSYFDVARVVFFIGATLAAGLFVLSEFVLTLWMGAAFAHEAAAILSILSIATLVDSVSNPPSMLNDGLGHPRVTGFFSVVRVALGVVLMFSLADMGVIGFAAANCIAAVLAVPLFIAFVHGRTIPFAAIDFVRGTLVETTCFAVVSIVVGRLLVIALPPTSTSAFLVGGMLVVSFSIYGYFRVLTSNDRLRLRKTLTQRSNGP